MSFEELSLADCAAHIVDNRGRSCPVGDSGLPLIATNCLRDEGLYPTYETTRFVSEETYRTWFRGHPKPGDLIFVTKGSPGRVCVAPDPVDFCIAQDMVAIRADESKVYPKYLFAVLRSDEAQRRISNMHVGTLIPHFKKGDFDKLLLPIPPRPEQTFIGDVYYEISSRIDLLRKTNVTLESIAQALFKSWFIDFDPVRAKAEGREPEGMDAATAALFPAGFEESIPTGWRAGTLEALCAQGGGLIQTGPFGSQLHASDYEADGIPVVMPQDLDGRRVSTDRVARVNAEHVERLARHKLQTGDVVFSRRGDVGRHAAVTEVEAGWLCGTGCLLVRPGPRWPSPAYVSQALATPEATEWLKRHAVGATMPNLNTGILGALPMLLPSRSVLAAFEGVCGALEARITQNRAQALALSELRDTLLPRLISGKLRLPEAREQLADALA